MTLQERVWQRRNRLRNRFSSLAASEPRESPAPDVAPRRKATLADVAERAGVSTSTASRALNGHGGLAPATRAAVQDAAAKLNFQPSALARSLRTQQTFTVGFVVPDVSSPFYAAALKGAQGRLEQAGYRVMLMDASLDVDRELAALETLLSHQVDGLLVASTGMPRALFDGAVGAAATPTIFFDGVVEGTGEGAVTLDNEGGITLLVDHLVEHGHERIAVLAGSQRESAGAARVSSAHSVVFALGLGAMVAAIATPVVEQILGEVGRVLAPLFDQLLFFILLPLGYLAAFVYAILKPFLQPILANLQPNPARNPDEDEALLREIERTRPFVVGGVEILIVVVVILVALVLLERAVRERRIAIPDGTELERSSVDGLSLGATLRGLFPRRPARRRPPREDGSASAALRLIYWRLVALAERAGHGWRVTAETPAEYQRRLAGADSRWDAAAPIVSAFEDLRYGEVAPDHATVSRARALLMSLEVALRT